MSEHAEPDTPTGARIGTLTLFAFLLPLTLPAAAAPRIETGFLDRGVTLASVSYRYQGYGGTDFFQTAFH